MKILPCAFAFNNTEHNSDIDEDHSEHTGDALKDSNDAANGSYKEAQIGRSDDFIKMIVAREPQPS